MLVRFWQGENKKLLKVAIGMSRLWAEMVFGLPIDHEKEHFLII